MAGSYASVRIDGLNAAIRALAAIGIDAEDMKDSMSVIARFGAMRAAEFAPKRSGKLAGDIRGNRAKAKAVITSGRKSIPYAGPINYGWPKHNITAAGYMQKADKSIQPWALRRLQRDLNQKIAIRGF